MVAFIYVMISFAKQELYFPEALCIKCDYTSLGKASLFVECNSKQFKEQGSVKVYKNTFKRQIKSIKHLQLSHAQLNGTVFSLDFSIELKPDSHLQKDRYWLFTGI